MTQIRREAGSFRDPSGYILHKADGVYRSLNSESYETVRSVLQSPVYPRLTQDELLIPTEFVDDPTQKALNQEEGLSDRFYVRHKRLWFISYPYEWSSEMLLDAARCTLQVQLAAMDHRFGLKDATAYNVQFEPGSYGPAPVFIDIASMERLPDTRGIWIPYKQFLSHFLLPLLFYRRMGYDFRGSFLNNMEGFEPEQAYRMVGPLKRIFPPYLTLVTLPQWLSGREIKGGSPTKTKTAPPSEIQQQRDLFILRHTVRSLQRKIEHLRSKPAKSQWSDYEDTKSYSTEAGVEKDQFVSRALDQVRPETVVDIGCNTGKFSLMAAERGAKVLALDSDMVTLDRLYRRAKELGAAVLPLRIDVGNPSPGIGWNNEERAPFLKRVAEFDCVLALAVVHHILITKGIPLPEITNLFHRLTRRYLVLELIGRECPMFQSLLRGRDALYAEFSLETQENILGRNFTVLRSHQLTGMDRRLYLLEKR